MAGLIRGLATLKPEITELGRANGPIGCHDGSLISFRRCTLMQFLGGGSAVGFERLESAPGTLMILRDRRRLRPVIGSQLGLTAPRTDLITVHWTGPAVELPKPAEQLRTAAAGRTVD